MGSTWSQVKQWVSPRNVTFKTDGVKLFYEQKFDEMRERERRTVCDHVKEQENDTWKQRIIDLEVDRLIIISLGEQSQ
jgi:hypothetical protein